MHLLFGAQNWHMIIKTVKDVIFIQIYTIIKLDIVLFLIFLCNNKI